MARKIKIKQRRKDLLKESDEFLNVTEEAADWSRQNWPLLLIGVGVLALLVIVGVLVKSSIADSKTKYANQVNEATESFQNAIQSDFTKLVNPEGNTDLSNTKSYEDVAFKFEKLMRDNPKTQNDPTIVIMLANAYMKSGAYDKARTEFGKIINNKNAGSLIEIAKYNTGVTYYIEKKYKEAGDIFGPLVNSQEPANRAGALVYYGYCLEEQGKLDEATKMFRLALDAYSDSSLTKGLESHIEEVKLKQSGAPSPEPKPEIAPANQATPESGTGNK